MNRYLLTALCISLFILQSEYLWAQQPNPNINPCGNDPEETGSISDYFDRNDGQTLTFQVNTVYTLCLSKSSTNTRIINFFDIEESGNGTIAVFRAFQPSRTDVKLIEENYDPDSEEIYLENGSTGYTFRFQSTGTFTWYSVRIRFTATEASFLEKAITFNVVDQPAPVDWVNPLSFSNSGEQLQLDWTVANQRDVQGYTLERSLSNRPFEKVADIDYIDNGSLDVDYTVLTLWLQQGAYYRIKQNDYAGTYDYSNVIFVPGNNGASQQFAVFPNPARDYARLSLPDDILSVDLINSAGQVVSRTPAPEARREGVDVRGVPAGVYYVRPVGGTRGARPQRLIVAR